MLSIVAITTFVTRILRRIITNNEDNQYVIRIWWLDIEKIFFLINDQDGFGF